VPAAGPDTPCAPEQHCSGAEHCVSMQAWLDSGTTTHATRNTQHATRNTQHATRNTQHAHATRNTQRTSACLGELMDGAQLAGLVGRPEEAGLLGGVGKRGVGGCDAALRRSIRAGAPGGQWAAARQNKCCHGLSGRWQSWRLWCRRACNSRWRSWHGFTPAAAAPLSTHRSVVAGGAPVGTVPKQKFCAHGSGAAGAAQQDER
jgi:hypothetical protein